MFQIKYGLGGGYGGTGEWEDTEAKTLEEAEEQAQQAADESFDMYGLGDAAVEEAEEEAEERGGEFTSDDADAAYNECKDQWVCWAVREVDAKILYIERAVEDLQHALTAVNTSERYLKQARLAKLRAMSDIRMREQEIEGRQIKVLEAQATLEALRNE